MLNTRSLQAPGSRRRGGFVQGCLVALGVVLLLLIVGGVVVALNFRSWSASAGAAVARAVIEESELPEAEKPEIVAIIDELRDEVKAKRVTLDEVAGIFADFNRSPILATGAAMQFQAMYVKPSKLTDDEKAASAVTFDRLAQAITEEKIRWKDLEKILDPIAYKTSGGHLEFQKPQAVSEDEIRRVIAQAKQAADDAGVPAEPMSIDLSDEFRKYVEERLGRPLGTPPGGGTQRP
ncbi:MAG: hypothetical protein Kow0022_15080 [Phycisphaerales bacterium]